MNIFPLMPAKYGNQVVKNFVWCLIWGLLTCYFIRYVFAHNVMWAWALICALLLLKSLKRTSKLSLHGLHQGKLIRELKTTTGNYGSAKWCSEEQIIAAGLDNPNKGVPVGVLGKTIFFFDYVHGLCVAPARSGKTISGPITAIAHGYRIERGNDKSCAAPSINVEVKHELSPMTKTILEHSHGHKIVFLNPSSSNGYPNTGFNPLYIIIDDFKDTSRHAFALSDSIEIANLLLPEPDGGVDKNAFFRNGSRNIIVVVVLFLAQYHPTQCHFGEVFSIVANVKRLTLNLVKASKSSSLNGDLASLASGILASEDDQFMSFVAGAVQVLLPFCPSSNLGKSVSKDEFRFESIRDPQQLTSVFIIAPYEHRTAYASWTGLVIRSATKALMRVGVNGVVAFNIDEATNFQLIGLAQDLTALGGFGLRCRIWIQARSELVRTVGRDSTETFYSQTDLKQFFRVKSYQEAKDISDFLGEYTVNGFSLNADSTSRNADLKGSWSEQGRKLYRPEDILNMANDEQIVLIDGLPPIKCKRLPYNHVKSWHETLEDNPIEGGKLPLDSKFNLSYETVKK